MKQLKFLFVLFAGILAGTIFTSCGSNDDEPNFEVNDYADAVVDGIAYHIENLEERTVSVVAKGYPNTYSGTITLPSTVNINGKSFTVTIVYGFDESSVTSVILPPTIKVIGNCAFYKSGLEKITIPSTVEVIGLGSFEKCEKLKNVIIEDSPQPLKIDTSSPSPTDLYGNPFRESLIETLYCGRNITNTKKDYYAELGIDGWVSENKNQKYTLKYLTLGENVSNTANIVFLAHTDIKTITCKNEVPPMLDTREISNKTYMETKIFVPESAVETYQENAIWGKFWNILPIN